MSRPLRAWARWRLDLVITLGFPRALLAEVWIELHERAVKEADAAARAEADNESGPYLVAPLRGMH